MKKVFTFVATLLFSLTAHAFQCPADMKKIDAALESDTMLSEEQMAEVKQLREDGEALHKAGKHQESVDALAKAKALLGIEE